MTPATEYERQLHRRLLEHDETASAEVCERFLTPLIEHFKRIYTDVVKHDETVIWDSVSDALLTYIEHPSKYDPQRGSLEYYLKMSAEGDLKNALKKEKRHQKFFDPSVELSSDFGKSIVEGMNNPEQNMVNQEITEQLRKLFKDEKDQELADLVLANERKTKPYAEILEITHLSEHEQQAQVKRAKDRIKAKLKRANWNIYRIT